MQIKTHLVVTLAWGLYGAFIMWLLAITGWNSWSSTSILMSVWGYFISIASFSYCGYTYTRGKPAAVRISTIAAAAIVGVALTWLISVSGLREWVADGKSWHAALAGFVTFTLAAAIAPFLMGVSKT